MNLTWERWRLAGVFLMAPQQPAGETPAPPGSAAGKPALQFWGASREILFGKILSLVAALCSLAARGAVTELQSPERQADAYFSANVLGIADVTGDGIGELAATSFGYNSDGAVFIFNGSDFSLVQQIKSPNPAAGGDTSQFGSNVQQGPDLNGDGIPDLMVGAPFADRPDLQSAGYGQVFVIDPKSGTSLLTLSPPRTQRGTRFGYGLAHLPDPITGKAGRIAVGAIGTTSGSPGQVHVFDVASGELILSFNAPEPRAGDFFGVGLASLDDVDGDGRADVAVGSGNSNGESGSPGAAYLMSAQTGQLLHRLIPPDLPVTTPHRWSVAAVADVNGDGKTDVLVGVPLASPPGAVQLAGRAYLFSGADGRLLRTLISPEPQVRGFFGWNVASLPDITGDGTAELLISGSGRPAIGSLGERRVHLINGATGQPIQTFQSPTSGEAFGGSVTGILDQRGRLRTIVSGTGVAAAPSAPIRSGRAYVFPLSLSFLSASVSDEGMRILLTTTDDKGYEVQASTDLQTWTPVTKLKDGMPTSAFLDKDTKGAKHRFYRTKQVALSP